MKRFYKGVLTALAATTCLAATSAEAQSIRGFRAEVQSGLDIFHSEGDSHTRLAFGGALGVDFNLGGGFIIGPEATFWRSHNKNTTEDGPGVAERWSRGEYTGALRLGYQFGNT